MTYQIMLQKDSGEHVKCKAITRGVDMDPETGIQKGTFPLKARSGKTLPLLKVMLVDMKHTDHVMEFIWTNFYEEVSASPGVFRLVRKDLTHPVMLYVKGSRKSAVDYVAMALKFGSHYDKTSGWTWGPRQIFQASRTEMMETNCPQQAGRSLLERFGKDLAVDVIHSMLGHELYKSFHAKCKEKICGPQEAGTQTASANTPA